jgi:hypothetical protein
MRDNTRYFASVEVIRVVLMKVLVSGDVVPCHWQIFTDILGGCTASIFRVDISCYLFLDW